MEKSPIVKRVDKLSVIIASVVIGIALLTMFIWILSGAGLSFALARAAAVIIIGCPCMLLVSVRFAIKAGKDVAAENKILFNTASAMEDAVKAKTIAIDKTGIITKGEPIVTDIFPAEALTSSGYSLLNNLEDELVKIAGILESRSEHPWAKAINSYIKDLHPYEDDEDDLLEVTDFEMVPGMGLKALLNGHNIYGGSLEFIEQHAHVHSELKEKAEGLASVGRTPVFYAIDKRVLGIIAVSDTIKNESVEAVKELKNMGLKVVMITGDNKGTSKAIGDHAGVDEVIAEIMPGQKENTIDELKKTGNVAVVADAVKDKAALTKADTGIAIGTESATSADTADVVLERDSLLDAAAVIRLSGKVQKIVNQNILGAVIYYIIGIPMAAGAYISIAGFAIGPLTAIVVLCLVTALAIFNAMRLKSFDIHDSSKD